MQRFSVVLKKEGYGAPHFSPPPDLVLTPERWSASDRGGMRQCTVLAAGTASSLVSLAGWLGDRIEIYNEQGDLVFWGILWDIEITIANVVYSSSLENIYNRIAVIYPHNLADGSVESRTTDWVEDADSIDRFGIRELLYGVPENFTSSADTVRDTLLERLKTVAPVISTQGGSNENGARLIGQGVWQRANSIYFTNPDGLIEFDGETTSFMIGRYMTSDEISFGNTSVPGSESDEMQIATGDFSPLVEDDTFTVSGSAHNNDTYTIDHFDAPNKIVISGNFNNEEAGATVKISYGEGISYDNIAQSFVLVPSEVEGTTSTWVCTHVAIKCRQVGEPSDGLRVALYPDAGGVPGTFLTFEEKAAGEIFTELTWMEFAFDTPITLTEGVLYYIGIRRTGAASLNDGYEIAIDEDMGYADGTAQFYDGSAWVARDPPVDMPFRVIGEISSTAQIEKAIAAVPGFTQSFIQVDSLVPVRQFSDDQRTAMDVLAEMMDAGTSTGERLVAQVLPDDTVVISTETTLGYGDTPPMLDAAGKLHYGTGGYVSPGRLVFGQTIQMAGLLLFDSTGGAGTYVAGSEYDAATETLLIESEGALDPFHALLTSRG